MGDRTYFRGLASVRLRVGLSAKLETGRGAVVEMLRAIGGAARQKTHSCRSTARLHA